MEERKERCFFCNTVVRAISAKQQVCSLCRNEFRQPDSEHPARSPRQNTHGGQQIKEKVMEKRVLLSRRKVWILF